MPLAAEETDNPKRDMPRGLIAGMAVLLVFAALMLTIAPGSGGADTIMESDNPLPAAIDNAKGDGAFLGDFVNYIGLAGLIASFFSIIYGYSRQLFALSRAGYLPKALSVTSSRKVPWLALLVPAAVGFLLAAFTEDGATMLNIAVFGAAVSYVLMMLSHIVLRSREPDLERPYRTPGGTLTTGRRAGAGGRRGGRDLPGRHHGRVHHARRLRGRGALYFGLYSRHHLVASAPEEEFESISKAEAELAH